jgi:hypothetical protein
MMNDVKLNGETGQEQERGAMVAASVEVFQEHHHIIYSSHVLL